ncbi:Nonribosomal peptide synthetase gloA [Bienertia sinuspersici]
MAAAPVKSPLHNFPLTFLKWGSKKDQQRCRRTPYDSPPQSEADPSHSKHVGSRSSRNRRNNNSNNNQPSIQTQAQAQANDDENEGRESGKKEEVAEEAENEGESEKGWNLRPRRAAAMKGSNTNGNSNAHNHAHGLNTMAETTTDGLPKSMRLRGFENQGNGGGVISGGVIEKREKKKFWIALSRDEIEEDVYSMTGSKPSRRPKKRPKNVQKQLDNVFPGLWLVGISPEAYRGLDIPPKVHRITKRNCESFELSACRVHASIWRYSSL